EPHRARRQIALRGRGAEEERRHETEEVRRDEPEPKPRRDLILLPDRRADEQQREREVLAVMNDAGAHHRSSSARNARSFATARPRCELLLVAFGRGRVVAEEAATA